MADPAPAARPLRTAEGKADSRRKLMIAVRAACRRLGLGDDDRKALQEEVTGRKSMSDMTLAELGRVLDRLNKDWKGPNGDRAHLGKIRALWWTLYWLGEIGDPNDRALSAFVQRQTRITHLRFLDHRSAPAVIEALKAMCERAGVRWPSADETAEIAANTSGFNVGLHDRHCALEAISRRLVYRGALIGPPVSGYIRYLETALNLRGGHWYWTTHELDAGIRLLGKKLRRLIEQDAAA